MLNDNPSFSFTDFYTKLLRINNNSIKILSKLTESLVTDQDYIDVELANNANSASTTIYRIPSYSFLKTQMKQLSDNLDLLTSNKTQQITETSLIDKKSFVEPLENKSLILNNICEVKENTFLTNLKNKNIFCVIDATNKISNFSKNLEVREILFRNLTEQQLSDISPLLNKNDLLYDTIISTLNKLNIDFYFNDYIYNLEPITLKHSGTFILLSDIVDTTILSTSDNLSWYNINTIVYTDYSSSVSTIQELKQGDIITKDKIYNYEVNQIIKKDDKLYIQLRSFNSSSNKLRLGDVLQKSSDINLSRKIKIECDPFVKKIIFIRDISPNINIKCNNFGSGLGINPDNLFITTNGVQQSLKDFYLENIYDFSEFFEGLKSEMKISALSGIVPNTVILNKNNFKVVRINNHQTQPISTDAEKLLSDLTFYVSKKNNLNQKKNTYLEKKKNLISQGEAYNSTQIINIENNIENIDKSLSDIEIVINQLNTSLTNLNIDTSSAISISPKYRVRGFWDFPDFIVDKKKRYQDVIKFDIQYRYLSLVEVPNCNVKIDFNKYDGTVKDAIFSEWTTITTPTRDKIFNEKLGRYVWDYENIAESIPNINQLDLPISPYEKVEFRIRSISEAGYPENPLKSDWSNSVIIEFPDEYYSITSDDSNINSTINDISKNYDIQNTLSNMLNDINILKSKLENKANSNINFKNLFVTEYIKNNLIIDFPELSLINNNNILFFNLEQGTILNPAVDYTIDNKKRILITQEYVQGLNINDKLLFVYSI